MSTRGSIVTAGLLLLIPGLAFSMEWQPRSSYNPLNDENLGRHHPIVFANETHGFVLGGSTLNNSAANDFYQYEEATDTWTSLPPPPIPPRSFGYGVVLNQWQHPKAYLGFGAAATGERLNDLWEFDMVTYEWKELEPLPGLGRRHPSMVAVQLPTGQWQLHVGLGDGLLNVNTFANLNDYWKYDIDTNVWTQLPDFPGSRRHHPFFFGIGPVSYTGLGHSDGRAPYIERDFYSMDATTIAENNPQWSREADFASFIDDTLMTTEARVAGTEFSIVLPVVDQPDRSLEGAIGFVLSGDGDDHGDMQNGEFHAFYPSSSASTSSHWEQLPPHPGHSRWAPGSFVMRGTARVYFTSGYDRETNTLYSDVWTIDVSELFTTTTQWPSVAPTSTKPAPEAPTSGKPAPDTTAPTKPTASIGGPGTTTQQPSGAAHGDKRGLDTATAWPSVSTSDIFIADTLSFASSATSALIGNNIRLIVSMGSLVVAMIMF